jgi:hypothetical protein
MDVQRPSAQPGASRCCPAPVTDVCTNCAARVAGGADQVAALHPLGVAFGVGHVGYLHGEHAPHAGERRRERSGVAQVAGDQLGAERSDSFGAFSARVAHERADGDARGEQGTGGGAALLPVAPVTRMGLGDNGACGCQ